MTSELLLKILNIIVVPILFAVGGYLLSLERRITRFEVYMTIIKENAARILIAPTHHRRDELIRKFIADKKLPVEEAKELRAMLKKQIASQDEEEASWRWAAVEMLAALNASEEPRRWWQIWR